MHNFRCKKFDKSDFKSINRGDCNLRCESAVLPGCSNNIIEYRKFDHAEAHSIEPTPEILGGENAPATADLSGAPLRVYQAETRNSRNFFTIFGKIATK